MVLGLLILVPSGLCAAALVGLLGPSIVLEGLAKVGLSGLVLLTLYTLPVSAMLTIIAAAVGIAFVHTALKSRRRD